MIEIKNLTPEDEGSKPISESLKEDKEEGVVDSMPKKRKFKPWQKILFVFLGILLVFILSTGAFAFTVYNSFKSEKAALSQRAGELKAAVKEQNLVKIKEANKNLREETDKLKSKVQKYVFVSTLPIVGGYYQDVNHLLNAAVSGTNTVDLIVEAITPYSDLLGLSGAKAGQGETTMDRITFLVTTLDKIRPQLDKIGLELEAAKKEVDQINPKRYPEEYRGTKIRENISLLISTIDEASLLVKDAKPLLEALPEMMGVTNPKYYFVLFQNDGELRPTGGFMTAYGILKIDKGKVTPVLSEDIYSLDTAWGKKIAAPEVIKKYHKNVPYYYIRDMNISPDFAESIKPVMDIYGNQIPGAMKVDGVIAVDTQLLASLLKVLGTIGVPEWGNFSAETDKRCDCPQVVYRLEELADKPVSEVRTARKAVIGPLMHSILANAFNSPKDKIGALFNVGLTGIREKHVLSYMFDEKAQSAIEAFNMGGKVKDYDGDYQLLVDTNFAGAKSNLFIKQKIDEKIEVSSEGEVTKTLTIIYNNPFPASDCGLLSGGLCLNGLYRDWFRLYVPKGSTLIEMTGSEVAPETKEELGKTVFEGFYGDKLPLRPQSMTKVSFKYKLPFKVEKGKPYKLLIQKQAGVEKYDMSIDFNGKKHEFELREDKELKW